MQPINRPQPDWAVSGAEGRERRFLSSIYLNVEEEEQTNIRLLERWYAIQANEIRFKEYFLEDAEYVIVGFGTAGRVALSAVRMARQAGIKVGLFRPITLSPFPYERVVQLAGQVKASLVVEMNTGQMLEDVLRAVSHQSPVAFYGRLGGVVPFPEEILREIERIASHPVSLESDPRQDWLARMKEALN
jgi:2-oxoglutarate ferredoxin oxidoreductase subunit alpha